MAQCVTFKGIFWYALNIVCYMLPYQWMDLAHWAFKMCSVLIFSFIYTLHLVLFFSFPLRL